MVHIINKTIFQLANIVDDNQSTWSSCNQNSFLHLKLNVSGKIQIVRNLLTSENKSLLLVLEGFYRQVTNRR